MELEESKELILDKDHPVGETASDAALVCVFDSLSSRFCVVLYEVWLLVTCAFLFI